MRRGAGRPTGWVPWVTLAVGTTASLAANVAVGGNDLISHSLADWPALSMLVSVKLLFSMFDRAGVPDGLALVRDDHRTSDRPPAVPGTGPRVVPDEPTPGSLARPSPHAVPGDRAVPVGPGAVTDLIPAGRLARTMLAKNGRSFSRDNLAKALRDDGYGVSNARASLLIKILRAEDLAPASDDAVQRASATG